LSVKEKPKDDFAWRYGEGPVLEELLEHLKSTYKSHYTNDQNDIQTIDVFAYRGTLATTSIDNAIKYLMRYGKKNGKNELDLIKAIHYLILAIAFERKQADLATITAAEDARLELANSKYGRAVETVPSLKGILKGNIE
jgi:hypothetical protein|tara:strand:+ start:65 stop:481 length:417 start_codon:yes stop_codon:yes gene_type:complete